MVMNFSSSMSSTPSMDRRALTMSSRPLLYSTGVRISMSQPVRRAARRTFCPRLPMASDNWSSATTTVARFNSKHRAISCTSAGFRALAIRICDDSFHRTMSIFSSPSSSTMLRTRLPRTPTQAPTASTFESMDDTATFVRYPASRARARISMIRSPTSGTSSSKSRRM